MHAFVRAYDLDRDIDVDVTTFHSQDLHDHYNSIARRRVASIELDRHHDQRIFEIDIDNDSNILICVQMISMSVQHAHANNCI